MSNYKHPFFPWAILILILIAGVVWLMPSIADQMIHGGECQDRGGVLTFNGNCVQEIILDKDK